MPTERDIIILQIKGFDAAHYRRTEQYTRQIDSICQQAAGEYASLAGTLFQPDPNKPFSFDDYPKTRAAAARLTSNLAGGMKTVITQATDTEWNAACDKNDAFINSILKTSRLTPDEAQQYQARNLEALQAFQKRKIEGMDLSQRVWKCTSDIKETIELGIDVGLGEGRSAQELSRDLRGYLIDPNTLFRRVRDKYGNLNLSKAAKLYHPGQGVYRSSAKNAMRLARTEVNMAYRESEYLRWQQLDFVVGIRIWLSNNHTILDSKGNPIPLIDVCDDLAGNYPKTFRFVGWHPQCRCVVTPILSDLDEFNKERAGRFKEIVRKIKYEAMPSRRTVNAMPENFTRHIQSIAERSKGWKSQPYYIRHNFQGGTIAGGLRLGVAGSLKGAVEDSRSKAPIKNNSKPITEFDDIIKRLKRWAYAFGLDVSKLNTLRLGGDREPLRAEVERLDALSDERQDQWLEAIKAVFEVLKKMQAQDFSDLFNDYNQRMNAHACKVTNYYGSSIQALQALKVEAEAALAKAVAERAKNGDKPHEALLKKYTSNNEVDKTFKEINAKLTDKWFEHGDLKLDATSKKRVNGFTYMDGRIYLRADRLELVKSALGKIGSSQSAKITTEEADAMATLWHEITHNRNKIGNMRLGDKATSYMELANEFVARKTLSEFYKKLGVADTPHPEFMTTRTSTGYNRMVTNYDKVITRLKLDGDKVLDTVRRQLYDGKYTEQRKGLKNGLESGGIKKADGTAPKGTDVVKIVKLCGSCRWETIENWLKQNGFITEK